MVVHRAGNTFVIYDVSLALALFGNQGVDASGSEVLQQQQQQHDGKDDEVAAVIKKKKRRRKKNAKVVTLDGFECGDAAAVAGGSNATSTATSTRSRFVGSRTVGGSVGGHVGHHHFRFAAARQISHEGPPVGSLAVEAAVGLAVTSCVTPSTTASARSRSTSCFSQGSVLSHHPENVD
jgi:hypothetical protein